MIGDVVGRLGRQTVNHLLPGLRAELSLDMVIANGENAAGGFGLSRQTAEDLFAAGVDVITSGNHIWDQKEAFTYVAEDVPVLRPHNYSAGLPGRGYIVHPITLADGSSQPVAVLNLQGQVFMPQNLRSPFEAADEVLGPREAAGPLTMPVFVDFHAEATAEKAALAWYLAGRVSAVVGTHTHVATADPRLLPPGCAFISDLGMSGPRDSIIGANIENSIRQMRFQTPGGRGVVIEGPAIFNAVLIETDPQSHRATAIRRVDRSTE